MKRYIVLLFLVALLFACNKDRDPKIRYQVNCSGSCIVEFSMSGGLTQTETVSGSWSKNWKGKAGQQVYLSVTLTSPNGSFNAEVKIDDETFEKISSSTTNENLTISGKIPG
jgi:hypothetical protein